MQAGRRPADAPAWPPVGWPALPGSPLPRGGPPPPEPGGKAHVIAASSTNAYPSSRLLQIQFGEARSQKIVDHAADLGVSPVDAATYQEAVLAAAAAQAGYVLVRAEAKDQGATVRDAVRQMNRFAASIIATVRATAEVSNNPTSIYNLASIAPRQAPVPAGPPLQPSAVTCSLGTDGVNTITWRASPTNTSFSVQRQLTASDGTTTGYRALGGAAVRPLRDATIPAGTRTASYRVQAVRNGLFSAWSEPGALTLVPNADTETTELRIAA